MAKAPIAGSCKTRLQPCLGARGASQLQARLIRRVIESAEQTGAVLQVFAAMDIRHPAFLRLRRQGIRVRKQTHGDLGRRMHSAARYALKTHKHCLILGTDCPSLTPDIIAGGLTNTKLTTLIPARDGGYVAIAVPDSSPTVFSAVDWGTSRVLKQTQRNFRREQRHFVLHSALADLDEPQDWKAHRRSKILGALDCCQRC